MKDNSMLHKLSLAAGFAGMLAFSACEDYLTVLPSDKEPEENFWKSKGDLESVARSAYMQLASSDVTDKLLKWGELRSDNIQQKDMTKKGVMYLCGGMLQPTDAMYDWAPFYKGINYCNKVLEHGEKMTQPGEEVDPSFRQSDWQPYKAEMIAARALFYFDLVRAFRDVPYVKNSISTDAEALNSRPRQTSGAAILGEQIADLEETWHLAGEDYGTSTETKGRFTKISCRALLADLYLWRGCMLMNFKVKGDSIVNLSDVRRQAVEGEEGEDVAARSASLYVTADGVAVDSTYAADQAQICFDKAIEHSQGVIDMMETQYRQYLKRIYSASYYDNLVKRYEAERVFFNLTRNEDFSFSDAVYSSIFGSKNSRGESILEWQYDGSSTFNSAIGTNFLKIDGSAITSTLVTAANEFSSCGGFDPEIGFGQTDSRFLQSVRFYPSVTGSTSAGGLTICKGIIQSIHVNDWEDMTSIRNNQSNVRSNLSSNWPIYRLTDIMLIKAEAIARKKTVLADELKAGFQLVQEIFKRCNKGLEKKSAGELENLSEAVVAKMGTIDQYMTNLGNAATKANLLKLVYRERQREFIGEGKRWFDIVRQGEYAADDIASVLGNFTTLKSAVRNRLKAHKALYCPVYDEEIKVNSNLVQNPVWERYVKK